MSIYKHKRTGVLYRVLCGSFDVATQEHQWVYCSLATGEIFNRSQVKFAQNFLLLIENVQAGIVPKEPHS